MYITLTLGYCRSTVFTERCIEKNDINLKYTTMDMTNSTFHHQDVCMEESGFEFGVAVADCVNALYEEFFGIGNQIVCTVAMLIGMIGLLVFPGETILLLNESYLIALVLVYIYHLIAHGVYVGLVGSKDKDRQLGKLECIRQYSDKVWWTVLPPFSALICLVQVEEWYRYPWSVVVWIASTFSGCVILIVFGKLKKWFSPKIVLGKLKKWFNSKKTLS